MELLSYLLKNSKYSFRPIDIAKEIGVNNKTIINRTAGLVEAGFVIPKLANQRIISYELTEYAKENREDIIIDNAVFSVASPLEYEPKRKTLGI